MKTKFISLVIPLLGMFCFFACNEDSEENDACQVYESPITPGDYESFLVQNDGSVTNVRDYGMTILKNGSFIFVTNTYYYTRFEGKFTFNNDTLMVKVAKCWNRDKEKMVSASGTVVSPCTVDGNMLTFEKTQYFEMSDGSKIKIPLGTYRLQ